MSVKRWLDKQNVVYTYNSILPSLKKRNTIYARTWMKLENINLSEKSQTQKDKHCRFHLNEVPRVFKVIGTESRREVTRNLEKGNGELVLNGYRV